MQRSLQWFRRAAEKQKQADINLLTHLLEDVKMRQAQGTVPDCLTTQALATREKAGLTELDVAYAVSSPFGAGIETVSPAQPRSCRQTLMAALSQTAGTMTTFFCESTVLRVGRRLLMCGQWLCFTSRT